jgi:translin
VGAAREALRATHEAREQGLSCCRLAILASGRAVRAVHRLDPAGFEDAVAEAERCLREAQAALADHPSVAYAGLLYDAEKEFSEARLTFSLVGGGPLPSPGDLMVDPAAWCNGLAEAASELRRHLLDRLREGNFDRAAGLLEAMEDVYESLLQVDFPDQVTGGLRRTTDALRAVLERSRSDLTLTFVQERLRRALERTSGDA